MAQNRRAVLILVIIAALWGSAAGQSPKFFPDDPIEAMPAPLPVGKPVYQEINEDLDLLSRSRKWVPPRAKPAGAVNTLGEVPDSEWFTNRHARQRLSRDALQRGSESFDLPAPPFTMIGGKNTGVSHGFRMTDSKNRTYFVKVDPLNFPEMASAADVIVSKFLYAIGYNTPKNDIVNLKLSDLRLSDKAMITPAGERPRKMTWDDVEMILDEVPHYRGSFRIMASLRIEGESIGPFLYEGTRHDDPNDIVPHEDRRDLRGLYVFSAWLNDTDRKPSNTYDVVVVENKTRFIRHYLLDFGNALGSDGDAAKDPRLSHEFLLPTPTAALKQILSLGLFPESWELVRFPKLRGVGNFEAQSFDPDTWKSAYPNPAFMGRLPDDDYWGAKQVMAFTDDDIRAIVETARFTDPQSTEYMIRTLAERRDKIGRTFFSKILALDHFRVENEELRFDDLAVQYGFQAPRSYHIRWSEFDNVRQTHRSTSGNGSNHLPREAIQGLPGSYFCAAIDVPGDPVKRASVYLRKEGNGYRIVGIDRL
jgi:hypothetical protein